MDSLPTSARRAAAPEPRGQGAVRPVFGAKQAALQLGFRAGLLRLMQLARRREAVILTFHRFAGEGTGDPSGLPVAKFAAYMEYLARCRRVVSLPDLARQLRQGEVRPYAAAVTVDDGYEEFFSLAVPVLRTYGIPASVFVISDFVDGRLWPWTDRFRFVFEHAPRGPVVFEHRGSARVLRIRDEEDRWRLEESWREYAKTIPVAERDDLLGAIADACGVDIPATAPREYRPMTWAQLRALAAEGFDVGAHTRTHPVLSRVPPERLQDEIGGCKEHLERNLGSPVAHFAYPNGRRQDYTPQAVEAVARAGYVAAVTTVAGSNTADTPIFELQRIDASAADLAHFAQSVSGLDLLRTRLRSGLQRRLRRSGDVPEPAVPGSSERDAMDSR